jgi:FAD/FMN-containing dehydrogenase
LDVTVPLGDVGRFVADVPARVADRAPCARVWMWGHAGDGNVHVNLTDLDPADEEAAMTVVLDLVLGLGGSVSAEHGIGRLKRQWLARQRGDADVAAMRAIKSALDPDGVFQPDLLFRARTTG